MVKLKNLINEGQKRDSHKAYMKYYKAYEVFAKQTVELAKTTTKLSGDKTDQNIILKNFRKYVIPFAGLMNSWDKGQQQNPGISEETINEDHHDYNEGKMAKYDVKEIAQDAIDVFKMIDKEDDLPEWLEAKITKAADYMNSVKDYLTHQMGKEKD